jgi:hypothetical protein
MNQINIKITLKKTKIASKIALLKNKKPIPHVKIKNNRNIFRLFFNDIKITSTSDKNVYY